MINQLLKQVIDTDTLTITNIIGCRNPYVDEETIYTIYLSPKKNLRKIKLTFGMVQDPSKFSYIVSVPDPDVAKKEEKLGAIGTNVPGFSYQIPITRKISSFKREQQFILLTENSLKKKNLYEYKIAVNFRNDVPEGSVPSENSEFNLFIKIDVIMGRTIFGRRETIPADALKVATHCLVPIKRKNVSESGSPLLKIINNYGQVSIGKIRQIVYRAESLGYFMQEFYSICPRDEFIKKIKTATQKITETWHAEIMRTESITQVTLPFLAQYDSWAGLGKIVFERSGADHFIVKIKKPFTERWAVEESIQAAFWEGYIRGSVEAITGVEVNNTVIDGSSSEWIVNVTLTNTHTNEH